MPSVYLARILLYPIKSLDPVEVLQASITEGGTLRRDREWALFDAQGKVLNAKREPRLHLIRAVYGAEQEADALGAKELPDDAAITRVRLSAPGVDGISQAVFNLEDGSPDSESGNDIPVAEAWLSTFLGQPVELRCNNITGFPDDLEASGPTLVSTSSLAATAQWFPPRPEEPDAPGVGFDVQEARLRFRTNLELASRGAGRDGTGVESEALPAFWEDQLFGAVSEEVAFRIGPVEFRGRNPCQRCAVPGRDSQTGEVTPRFTRIFSDQRKATLPPWVNPARFNHFYRFAVNTVLAPGQAGRVLRSGDKLSLG
jgi:uncharacterized protein YcbX